MGILVRWIFLTGAILLASYLIDGIKVSGFFSAFLAAAILGILNALLRPVLIILTLPINILTLGLFTFVINAVLLMMASGVIKGFEVQGFWSAFFGALIIAIVNWVLGSLIGEKEKVDYIDMKEEEDDHWE